MVYNTNKIVAHNVILIFGKENGNAQGDENWHDWTHDRCGAGGDWNLSVGGVRAIAAVTVADEAMSDVAALFAAGRHASTFDGRFC